MGEAVGYGVNGRCIDIFVGRLLGGVVEGRCIGCFVCSFVVDILNNDSSICWWGMQLSCGAVRN